MGDVKRRYDSSRRRAAAEQTRQRLITSARRLFAERGFAKTTIEAIAADAGTAPQTFYKVLGSKRAALFTIFLEEMAANADPAALTAALQAADGPAEQLTLLVDYRVRLFTGAFDVLETARTAAPIDPDAAALWAEGEARRWRNQQDLLTAWRKAGALRAGLDPAQASVILWAMTGPDLYRLFVVEKKWPVKAYRDWLADDLSGQLFGMSGIDRAAPGADDSRGRSATPESPTA